MKRLSFLFIMMMGICLWSCDFGGDSGFIQKGYVYRAHYTKHNVYDETIPTDLQMSIYKDGSVELIETSTYHGETTEKTYKCSLTHHYNSYKDIPVYYWHLEGHSSGEMTQFFIDEDGHGYIPMFRDGHEAVASGNYDFTFTKSSL